jgi:hypothetical protein
MNPSFYRITNLIAYGVCLWTAPACKDQTFQAPIEERQPAQAPPTFSTTQIAPSTREPIWTVPSTSSSWTQTSSTLPTTTLPQVAQFLTQGNGGVTTTQEVRSRSGGRYWVYVPQNPNPASGYGLLVLLHGSGASSYREFVQEMSGLAQNYRMIAASVLAPNGSGWNEGNQPTNAQFLNDLIQNEVFRLYNIDKRRVIFSGQSSGGGFLGSHFVPLFGENYQGGAFMQCGAEPPAGNFRPSPQMQQKFRLHMEITTGDLNWRSSVQQAAQTYQQAGLQVTAGTRRPGGHCQFSQSEVISGEIQKFLPTGL